MSCVEFTDIIKITQLILLLNSRYSTNFQFQLEAVGMGERKSGQY